jgi:hypothetical protein
MVKQRILADKPTPGDGLSRLPGHHPAGRAVLTRARWRLLPNGQLVTGACRYQSVKSILKNALDQQPLGTPTLPPAPPSPHDNIRGAEYFE